MAKYDVTYVCGHTGSVNLIGPHRSRESRIASLERGVCFECYKQYATETSREQAEALELPALVGSEKQIAWAETLRIAKLTEIEAEVEKLNEDNPKYRQVLMAVEKISNEISAKQWIEWRHDFPSFIISSVLKALLAAPTEEQKRAKQEAIARDEAIRRAAIVEATIRPTNPLSELSAELHLQGNIISALFPENRDDFKQMVKERNYSWSDGCWKRTIGKFAGNPADRLVELGHTLLAKGFLVRVFDSELRTRIVSGQFEPEQTRWITKYPDGKYAGWFCISWGPREDYYQAAMRLPNSKYSRPFIAIPPAQFEQVLDFAHMYDFKLSEKAQEVAKNAKEDKGKMLVVTKEPVVKHEDASISDKPPVLIVPDVVEIADELRDED